MAAANLEAGKSKAKAELFVLSGPDVGRSYEVVHGSTVGRAPDRGVVLRDKSISRHHAHFECAEGSWSIVDDGSTNGFMVDGSRREKAQLTELREFVIGEVLVRLRIQAASAAAAPAVVDAAAPAPVAPAIARAAALLAQSSDEIEIEDEILLDSAPESARTVVSRAPSRPSPPSAPTLAAAVAARAATDPGLEARGRGVLQFHKEDARSGLLVTDLAQRPWWVRGLVFVIVLALTGALGWGVYRGVLSMREGVSVDGEPHSAAEEGQH